MAAKVARFDVVHSERGLPERVVTENPSDAARPGPFDPSERSTLAAHVHRGQVLASQAGAPHQGLELLFHSPLLPSHALLNPSALAPVMACRRPACGPGKKQTLRVSVMARVAGQRPADREQTSVFSPAHEESARTARAGNQPRAGAC